MANPRGNPNWKKGVSANPQGTKLGSRHKVTLAVEALLDGQAEGLTQKAVQLALKGNETALRLCLDRICPPRKDWPIRFKLPENLNTASDVSAALSLVIGQTAEGEIGPGDAMNAAGLLEIKRRAIETSELERRLLEIEAKMETK
jgi:hypothetical protein